VGRATPTLFFSFYVSLPDSYWFLVVQLGSGSMLVEQNVNLSRSQLHIQLVWICHHWVMHSPVFVTKYSLFIPMVHLNSQFVTHTPSPERL
jgi:hypothetical protein